MGFVLYFVIRRSHASFFLSPEPLSLPSKFFRAAIIKEASSDVTDVFRDVIFEGVKESLPSKIFWES